MSLLLELRTLAGASIVSGVFAEPTRFRKVHARASRPGVTPAADVSERIGTSTTAAVSSRPGTIPVTDVAGRIGLAPTVAARRIGRMLQ